MILNLVHKPVKFVVDHILCTFSQLVCLYSSHKATFSLSLSEDIGSYSRYVTMYKCRQRNVCTVNVQNPNVRISNNAEIRTNACSVQSCSDFGRSGLGVSVRFKIRLVQTVLYIKGVIKMIFFYIKRPSLVTCLKSERSNSCLFGFRTEISV